MALDFTNIENEYNRIQDAKSDIVTAMNKLGAGITAGSKIDEISVSVENTVTETIKNIGTYNIGVNRYDISKNIGDFLVDSMLNSNGDINTNNKGGYFITPYIKVEPDTQYTITYGTKSMPSENNRMKCYTKDLSLSSTLTTSSTANENGTLTFTTPSDAEYLRISGLDANFLGKLSNLATEIESKFNETFMMVYGGNENYPSTYVAFNDNFSLNDIQTVRTGDTVVHDMLERERFTSGYLIDSNQKTENENYSISEYIDISDVDQIFCYFGSGNDQKYRLPRFSFYKEASDDKIITCSGNTVTYDFIIYDNLPCAEIKKPYGANYLVVCMPNADVNTNIYHLIFAKWNYGGKCNGTFYEEYAMNYTDEKLKSFTPKANQQMKIVNMGDSLFFPSKTNDSIGYYLEQLTGATIYNCAFGASHVAVQGRDYLKEFNLCKLADSIESGDFSNQENAIATAPSGIIPWYFAQNINTLSTIDLSDVDIITISIGTNDWGNCALDNPDDKYDINTYCGAYRYSIEKILGIYPNLRIVLCTPMWRCEFVEDGSDEMLWESDTFIKGNNQKLSDFADSVKSIANEYHFPVCDFYNKMSINKFNWKIAFDNTDGTHPHAKGRYLMAKKLAEKLAGY